MKLFYWPLPTFDLTPLRLFYWHIRLRNAELSGNRAVAIEANTRIIQLGGRT